MRTTTVTASVRLILLAGVLALRISAQGDRGVITGTVTDASGAVVPGAEITVTQRSTNVSYKTTTSTAGDFTATSLPVGEYQVKVEKPSFKRHITENVVVVPGGTARVDVLLEVGTTQQSVEVMANAQMVQSENARVSTTVSSTLVDSLPVQVNGASRSPFDLASTTAEVNAAGTFRIGGGNDTVGITLDGSSLAGDKIGSDAGNGGAAAMNSPSVEALTEFTVEAGGFKAETGHVSGGTLSFVSKSGTNQFHGSAFEFLRNQDLDARGFFNTVKSVYKQNDFGVTAGGPVYFPKLYNGRNKTFFFASYEGFRNRVGAGNGTLSSVPPPEFYTGDLHNWVDATGKMYQVYDPASQTLTSNGTYTRTPFPNNQIPQTRFDPVVVPILNYMKTVLQPNVPNLVPGTSAYVRNNFFSTGTSSSPSDRWSAKIDQSIGARHHLSYLMNRYKDTAAYGANGPPGLPYPIGGYSIGNNITQVYRGTWDYTVTPTLISRFYGGFNYFREDHGSAAITADSPQSSGISGLLPAGYWKSKGICIPNYPECANFPIISTGDFAGWGTNGPNGSDRLVFELHEDVTKIKGAHTFKGGYFFGDSHYDGFGLQNGSGSLGFSYTATSVPLATSEATGGGSGFASFLLGAVNNFALDTPRYLTAVYRTHQFYFQDDWKVSRKLTVNLGFRYEMNLAPISVDDKISDFSPATPNPGAGGIPGATIFAGTGAGRIGRRNIIDNWYGGYGPRLAFAYAVNNKTTIRGAATRSFGPLAGIGQSSHNLGFAVRETIGNTSGGLNPAFYLQNGAPAWPTPPTIDPAVGIGTNPPAYAGNQANRSDSELNYSFNIQRQITPTSVLEIGYLGTLASDITSNFLALNQVPYRSLPASLSPFTTAGRTALGSLVGSAAAIAAGVNGPPWTCGPGSSSECVSFNTLFGSSATVSQAMRPFPQYTTINTLDGGGDRIGHSTYHSMMIKYNKRLGSGLTVQGSYSLSKLLTDTDSTASIPGDMYNLRLLKSIAAFDQTNQVKLAWVYELPVGHGKHFLGNGGVVAAIVGGWRVSAIQTYASGLPSNIGTTVTFPVGDFTNRPTISTYDNWVAHQTGKFDPFKDSYLQPQSFFPTQPISSFGNSTRYNPKFRTAPTMSENPSLSRIFSFKERARLEVRAEAFNALNRVFFGPLGGATTLGNPNFGLWRAQVNGWRTMQLVAKMTW
ncbi:MAG TPA: TonB-dependent receptor [Bryobacteraceae bacterium]|nr:TonB-dependent receptor [Bryobacteraceae bacterium]